MIVWGKNAFLEDEKVIIYEQQTYDISKRWQWMTNKPVNQ